MNINRKSVMAGMLAATLVVGNTFVPVNRIYAAENEKEEVIYVNTQADGSIESINAVNIFGRGNVTDYGEYSEVKMLNTTDKINQSGEEITFSTDKDKVYYQGTMKEVQLPWNISVIYTLDGKEINPDELSGKSGKLAIHIVIDKNENSDTEFYDNYALQVSLSLDTQKCKNIVADGSTVANVGANKQISYTVLPGKGLDATVNSDVTDFEMDAISINGVKLDLNIDIDDAELMDKVKEIMDASKEINDGASKLSDGTDELEDGGSNFLDGANSLNSGAEKLDNGVDTLDKGITSMEKALKKLNRKSKNLTTGSSKILSALKTIQTQLKSVSVSTDELKKLTDSSAAIKTGISDAYNGAVALKNSLSYSTYKATMKTNGLDIEQLKNGNTQAIKSISSQIEELSLSVKQLKNIPGYESNETYKAQVKQLESQIESLKKIVTLLEGNNAAIEGTSQYLNASESGASQLVTGLENLKNSYDTFDTAIINLADNLSKLSVNVGSLKTGIDKLVDNYDSLDTGIKDYTDGVAKIVAAYSKITKGTESLVSGSRELVNGSLILKNGTSDLYNGIVSLDNGTKKLNDGTEEFHNKTDGMDTKIEDEIDDMLNSLSGSNSETKSFVSDKNTNVKSVQFVIKTTEIKKQETNKSETKKTEKLTFWEKLLKLFGV